MRHYETVKQHTNGSTEGPSIPVFDDTPATLPRLPETPPRNHTPDHVAFSNANEHVPDTHGDSDDMVQISAPFASSEPKVSYDRSAEYAAKLAEANAEISRLKELLTAGELRRRKPVSDDGSVGVTDDGASLVEQAVHPEGVPLNVVAILSFVVFVVTYLFF